MTFDPKDNRTRSRPNQFILEVGPREGHLRGNDDKTLQAGADYLRRLGGGVLHILPGEYTMNNALHLHPNLTIRGSGSETILKKAPSTKTPLSRDSDWYENQVMVEDPTGFAPGCGILLRGWKNGTMQVVKDTLVQIDGNVLFLSRRLETNFWLQEKALAATLFPLLTAEWVDDVIIEDLVLDGNREHNDEIDGNYAGGVFIQHCNRFILRNVSARNYNGDGFSFQVCDDVRFEDCRSENNAHLGFHPGSGSQRPIFRNCVGRRNGQGLFFCWGVTHGLVESCTFSANEDYGISIGHRDTDNRIATCTIEGNEKAGIFFRPPASEFRGGHRNLIEANIIRDNGFKSEGIGIDLCDQTHDIEMRDNRFEDSGEGKQRIGIRTHPGAQGAKINNNCFVNMVSEVLATKSH